MLFGKNLGKSCDELIDAAARRDADGFHKTLERIAGATTKAKPGEVQEVLGRLAPLLAEIPIGMGGDLAKVAGGMTDFGGDPMVVLPTLVRRATDAMERAARFATAYGEACGDLPDAEDPSLIEATIERFVGAAPQAGLSEREAYGLVEAWFAGGDWVQPVLYLAQRKEVRTALPERARLTPAIDATREHIGTAHWLYGLLLVVDDTPLTVLHRPTGRGYRVTISGIGDNFQLHTLLAASLIGDESRGLLPGERPSPAAIAAATDGEDLTPAGGIRGQFNLVDAYGEWIWHEGRPADIPLLEGERIVVLDPPPYARSWNAGRLYPLMRPSLTVDRILAGDEAAHWLGMVKSSQR
ncbi:hypothetical protein AAH979_37390 [Plantactinospora sp. ZYX-F-223]|uniref:hypothetical protein n=1 Tax=Plantactinospora sp. ZYX-F-223 TaxID=3144103 RepID=UPI0031FD5322